MNEYIYASSGKPLVNINGEISLARKKIVRCKDCKHGAYDGNECMRINKWDETLWFLIEPNGFCAWGERRENE